MPFIPDFLPAVGDIDAFIKVCSRVCYVGQSYQAAPVCLSEVNNSKLYCHHSAV